MAVTRVTTTGIGSSKLRMSREKGTLTGLQINTYVMDKLRSELTGEMIAPILFEALQPALFELLATWPILTGASRDSAEVMIAEVNPKSARAVLVIGGEQLIGDPRNRSHKDYAPYVEFNGTPKTPAGTLFRAVITTEDERRAYIHERTGLLIKEIAT